MMKKLLLATAIFALPVTGHALVPVEDLPAIAQEIQNTAQQLAQAKQIFDQALSTAQSLRAELNPNTYVQQLTSLANPLPGVGDMSSMITGGAGLGGVLNLANQFKSANTVYSTSTLTNGADVLAGMLNRQSNSWSNTQALAAQQVQDAQTRYNAILSLQAELPNISTQADLTAYNGRLEAEKAKLAALQTQMTSTQTMASLQTQQYQLQSAQQFRKSADELMTSFGGNVTSAGTTTVASTTPVSVPNFVGN